MQEHDNNPIDLGPIPVPAIQPETPGGWDELCRQITAAHLAQLVKPDPSLRPMSADELSAITEPVRDLLDRGLRRSFKQRVMTT
jgi:hypothetical protein